MISNRYDKVAGVITLITILLLVAAIFIATSCSTPSECSNMVEPSDSTNYNATYILP